MDPVRITGLFFSPEDDVTMSGGTRYALEIWEVWSARPEVELRILASAEAAALASRYGYPRTAARIRVVRTPPRAWLARLLPRLLNAAGAILHARPSGIVHAESSFVFDLVPAVLAKLRSRRLRLVAPVFHLVPPPWVRGGAVARNALAWLEQRAMLRLLACCADVIVVDNRALVDALAACGIPRERCWVTRMGVRRPAAARSAAPCYDAVFVGRLSAAKGVPVLLEAWRSVVDRIPSARLALVGIEQPGLALRERIAALGLDGRVTHLANLSDAEVGGVYASAKLFATASLEEGYGLALLEAFAHELPAVTFDLPAFAEAFPQGREIAAEPTPRALADALVRVLRDPARYAALRDEAARSDAVRSWDEVAADLLSRCTPAS